MTRASKISSMFEKTYEPVLELESMRIKVEEVPEFFSFYKTRLLPSVRASNNESEQLFADMEEGYERHYMKIVSFRDGAKYGNGMVFLNVDHTVPLQQRVIIRHISTIKAKELEKAFELVVNFIWRNIQCDNIRFELFHTKDQTGALKADPNFKACLQKAGFKWKNLRNDPTTGKRSQIMQLDRPKDPTKVPAFENPRGL